MIPEIEYNKLKKLSNTDILNSLLDMSELFHTLSNQEKNEFCVQFLQLKILLDTRLARYRIKTNRCRYTSFYVFHSEGNCDLREIIYGVNENHISEIAKKLLSNIHEISQHYIHTFGKILHLLTDIDDTLFPHRSSTHKFFGEDSKGVNKQPYPGVIQFMKEFRKQHHKYISVNENKYKICNYITVLSATPNLKKESRFFDGVLRQIIGKDYSFLQGAESYGEIRESLSLLKRSLNNKIVGSKKFSRFKEYIRIFPEYQYIFLGDNGQGDYLTGKQIVKYANDTLVFIHNIQLGDSLKLSPSKVASKTKQRLKFFENYKGLSNLFYEANLLKKHNIENINNNIFSHKHKYSTIKQNRGKTRKYMRRKIQKKTKKL